MFYIYSHGSSNIPKNGKVFYHSNTSGLAYTPIAIVSTIEEADRMVKDLNNAVATVLTDCDLRKQYEKQRILYEYWTSERLQLLQLAKNCIPEVWNPLSNGSLIMRDGEYYKVWKVAFDVDNEPEICDGHDGKFSLTSVPDVYRMQTSSVGGQVPTLQFVAILRKDEK